MIVVNDERQVPMRKPIAGCLLLAPLLCSAALAGQSAPKGFSEVPKEKLRGLRLLLADAGCSVAAPGAEWTWLASNAQPEKNFLCFNPKTGQSYTLSVGVLHDPFNDHVREQVLACARQAAEARGSKVANEKWAPVQTPLPGRSWRLYYEETFKEGIKLGVVLYLVQTAGPALLSLQDCTTTGAESPAFTQFVRSLSLLK
jgi:hypothetical protein